MKRAKRYVIQALVENQRFNKEQKRILLGYIINFGNYTNRNIFQGEAVLRLDPNEEQIKYFLSEGVVDMTNLSKYPNLAKTVSDDILIDNYKHKRMFFSDYQGEEDLRGYQRAYKDRGNKLKKVIALDFLEYFAEDYNSWEHDPVCSAFEDTIPGELMVDTSKAIASMSEEGAPVWENLNEMVGSDLEMTKFIRKVDKINNKLDSEFITDLECIVDFKFQTFMSKANYNKLMQVTINFLDTFDVAELQPDEEPDFND